eukprot:GHVN01101824.1.p1 GENE.GHVN01101824.1~~GHVN01101824.1.p1  ORF type:complete len:180 (-),score=13.41 GHVN01101824.1:998-1480(-)
MTAQVQQQAQVTEVQSLMLLRNTVRTAISCIAYLRNLFEESAFEDRNVSGLQLKLLRPHNPEAETILSWLEDGVLQAIEAKYLRLLVFGIHNDQDDLLECFHFRFSYDGGQTAQLQLERTGVDGKSSQIKSGANYALKSEAQQQVHAQPYSACAKPIPDC